MGRRASPTFVASEPAGNGSAWRLFLFISNAFYPLLAIVQMICLYPLKLALVPFLSHPDLIAPEPSTTSTYPSNPRNRYTVVQGRDLSPAVQVEARNDDREALPALIIPVIIPPAPIPPMTRTNTVAPLQGSLMGIILG